MSKARYSGAIAVHVDDGVELNRLVDEYPATHYHTMELDPSLDTGGWRALRETSLLPRAGGVPWTVGSAVESRRATSGVLYNR